MNTTTREWTGIQIEEVRDQLERSAATILGFVIFEYSRLDMEVGWMLSWSDDGKELEKLTKKYGNFDFNKRLKSLRKSVILKFRNSPDVVETYSSWLSDAHAIRELRNQLFHGRWGVEATHERVVNVIGLPNCPDQKSVPYSIADLQRVLDSIRILRSRLQVLRSSWPV